MSSDTDSDTEENSKNGSINDVENSKNESINDAVSIRSKMAPASYDDDENFDDLLADLPVDDGENATESTEAYIELKREEELSDNERSTSVLMRTPSPDKELERAGSSTPERKDSRSSNGSSSVDERASSLSPEPPKQITSPSTKVASNVVPIVKKYSENIDVNFDVGGEEKGLKVVRQKPSGDITQIYTQKLVNLHESPKPEKAKFVRPSRDITKLYTAALQKEDKSPSRMESLPRRTKDITKLYTGGLGGADSATTFMGKPNDERTNPTKVCFIKSICVLAMK